MVTSQHHGKVAATPQLGERGSQSAGGHIWLTMAHESKRNKRNESERAASANVRGAPCRTASQQTASQKLIGAAPSMQAYVAAGGGAGGLPKRQTSATEWGGGRALDM